MAAEWPVWRLWLRDKMTLTEMNNLSIDDIEAANEMLDAWDAAQIRIDRRNK